MSGAYVGQELQTEFGRIPPSFLPLGNKRLFQHQIKLASSESKLYLTVPESYKISNIDFELLSDNNVVIIALPENLSLGQSLVAALNLSEHDFEEPLEVLFGDTLFKELPVGENFASLSTVENNYHWAVTNESTAEWVHNNGGEFPSNETENKVLNGYFKFSNPRHLLRCLAKSNWDFLQALNSYRANTNFRGMLSESWLDFGHVNTYYSSKANFTTQRSFNDLKINSSWVEKSSSKDIKIAAEANWFDTLPYSLRGYTPQFLGSTKNNGKVSYKLEYLHFTALNELYVFSELPSQIWKRILTECVAFLKACQQEVSPSNSPTNTLDDLFGKKTNQRLADFCNARGYKTTEKWYYDGITASLDDLIELSKENLPPENHSNSILHGDFCFSNILYDFRSNKIKAIDPRGLNAAGEMTIYGDIYYDIAKLSHSIIGLYDWIIAGYFKVALDGLNIHLEIDTPPRQTDVQKYFLELVYEEFSLTLENIIAMQIQLFLSMLPLHSDNRKRQDALFANAFRLHKKLLNL